MPLIMMDIYCKLHPVFLHYPLCTSSSQKLLRLDLQLHVQSKADQPAFSIIAHHESAQSVGKHKHFTRPMFLTQKCLLYLTSISLHSKREEDHQICICTPNVCSQSGDIC